MLRWRRRRMPASFLLLACNLLAETRTKATDTAAPAGRQAHWPQRGLAGPSPFGSGSLVVWLCIHSTAPAPRCCRCGGWTGRGTLCLRLPAAWPCPAPLTDTRCTHVRAGLLLLLAVVHPTTGSLLCRRRWSRRRRRIGRARVWPLGQHLNGHSSAVALHKRSTACASQRDSQAGSWRLCS